MVHLGAMVHLGIVMGYVVNINMQKSLWFD
jgi:hypothetical protein